MKTGIIGLPQVGKTSLFKILTKAKIEDRGYASSREAHRGIAKVPDERLDRLAALYNPKKLVHATIEYADVAAIGQEALKESAYANNLRTVDALAHVVRAFDDPSIPHVGPIDPLRDIKNVDFDLVVSDLGQIEKRLVRLSRKTYELMGLISFFTVGEDECRAWTVERKSRAQAAAGAIHSDLEKHFIRAETIHWDQLLAAGSEANARAKGTLRLEGKDYIVQDGDVMHIRHSG